MHPAWTTTILVICVMQIGIYPAKCDNPKVSRRRLLIYRIAEEVEVDVVQCKYYDHNHPALTYFDITKNCLISPKTRIFVDKWEERNSLNDPVSLVDMKQYKTKADLFRNEIKLRSGTICRYDRGFCYDALEKENYAAVWEVKKRVNIPVESCPKNLEQLFYGPVDIWDFPEKQLKYLVYSDNNGKAFSLRLVKRIDCQNIETWVTEGNSFLISTLKLTPKLKNTSKLNQQYFPTKSLTLVSEAILKNAELQEYPLDFNSPMSTVYFEEPDNARILFYKLREELKLEIKSASELSAGGPSNPENQREINNLKESIIEKTNEIKNILRKIKLTEDNLLVTKNDVSNFQALVDSFFKTYNKDIVDFNITLSQLNKNIYSEGERISKLIAAENLDFMQKFERLNNFVKNQVFNLPTESELAEKLSELREELQKLLNEQTTQFNILVEKNEQFEHSLNALRNYKTDLEKDIGIVKSEYDSKLGILEQQVNENFDLFKKELKKVVEQNLERTRSPQTDSEIADLRKNIEDFKISLKRDSEISFNEVRGSIETISQNYIKADEFVKLQAQIDVMNRYIANVEWDILKNIKVNPISSEFLNNELSALRESVNKNIEQLKQDFSKKFAQHESRCHCNAEINKLSENFKSSLEAAQQYILQTTNSLVETTKTEILSELKGATLILDGKIDINKVQLVEIITHRLQEKEKQIDKLERTLSAKIQEIQQKTDEVSKKVDALVNESQRPPESE